MYPFKLCTQASSWLVIEKFGLKQVRQTLLSPSVLSLFILVKMTLILFRCVEKSSSEKMNIL